MSKGPEGQEAQEPTKQDSEFIAIINKVEKESDIRQLEGKNRDFLEFPSRYVRTAFDAKWKELTGSPYWQRITTVPVVMAPYDGRNDTRRSDPKSMNYRQLMPFEKIYWQKIKRKVGKKIKDFFVIEGVPKDADKKRLIFGSLSVERLYDVFGDQIASKIMSQSKKDVRGYLPVAIDIDVEGYWEVQFAPQKDQNDTKDVRLTVEGICLRALRMVPVMIPGFYLENADNTTKDIHSHEAGKGRMVTGKVQKYPYTVLRQVSMEEYLAFKKEGDKIQREAERREEELI